MADRASGAKPLPVPNTPIAADAGDENEDACQLAPGEHDAVFASAGAFVGSGGADELLHQGTGRRGSLATCLAAAGAEASRNGTNDSDVLPK